MKTPKMVRVIKSDPKPNQDGCEEIIGEEFKVVHFEEENEEVQVMSEKHEGLICLSKSEYEVVV